MYIFKCLCLFSFQSCTQILNLMHMNKYAIHFKFMQLKKRLMIVRLGCASNVLKNDYVD